MGPPCQGAAQVLQGLTCAVRGSVSHDYREGTTPPGQSYLEAETLDPEHASVTEKPGRFNPQLFQEQTKPRAACVHTSSACTT